MNYLTQFTSLQYGVNIGTVIVNQNNYVTLDCITRKHFPWQNNQFPQHYKTALPVPQTKLWLNNCVY